MSGKKAVDIYTMEFYVGVKKKEILPFVIAWVDLENIILLAKWNKPVRERQIPYDFTYMWTLMNKINKQTK